MALRPQDLMVALKLAVGSESSYPRLATSLGMSMSEVHAAVQRAIGAGLVTPDRKANRAALLEFIVHGVKYSFVPKRGPLTRGMPTAHAAPPLDGSIGQGSEPPPVWPDPRGTARGESFEPLYRSAPKAARSDPKLYAILCLVDAIRGGRARERAAAERHLEALLAE